MFYHIYKVFWIFYLISFILFAISVFSEFSSPSPILLSSTSSIALFWKPGCRNDSGRLIAELSGICATLRYIFTVGLFSTKMISQSGLKMSLFSRARKFVTMNHDSLPDASDPVDRAVKIVFFLFAWKFIRLKDDFLESGCKIADLCSSLIREIGTSTRPLSLTATATRSFRIPMFSSLLKATRIFSPA